MSEPRIYGRSVSANKRWDVMQRYQFQCVYCGRSAKDSVLDVDHVVPIAAGGTNEIDNLVPACVECNMGKGAKRLENLPPAIRNQASAADKESIREMYVGWFIAGSLFVPPFTPYEMLWAEGIAMFSATVNTRDGLAKVQQIRADLSLTNKDRFGAMLDWIKDRLSDIGEDE